MSTISSTIYSSLSALNTYSVAIDVTSTNIANAESAGYSRQTAVISERLAGNGTGCGADVTTIKRACNSFFTAQLRQANGGLGKSSAEVEVLSSVEQVFSESGNSGLSAAMSDFWNAWQEVVNDPSASTGRLVLASAADNLAETFNSMSSELSEISAGIEDSLGNTVARINDLVRQIGEANQQTFKMQGSGENTNAIKDTLDSLVTELSSLIDIDISTNHLGQVSIEIDGYKLVAGTETGTLSMSGGMIQLTDTEGSSTNITQSSGELGGYLEARKILVDYQGQLDALADKIVFQVNTRHAGGYDLDGNTGIDFFDDSTAGAGGITVNWAILDDPRKIAAAATSTSGSGDGSNAEAIANLQNSLLLNSGTATFSDYYNALVTKIGATVQSAQIRCESASNAQAYYTNACLSVSGVSTEEEMAKLVLYQNAYEAAAKIMAALDEMMQTLITMM